MSSGNISLDHGFDGCILKEMKQTSIRLLLSLLLLILVNGCSTNSDDTTSHNDNAQAQDSTKTKQPASTTKAQDSLALRNAVIECLKRKSFTGEVRGIGIVDPLGDMFSNISVAAVEINPQMFGSSLIYVTVCQLEDKDGNEYQHAEFLTARSGDIALLLTNKRRPNDASGKE